MVVLDQPGPLQSERQRLAADSSDTTTPATQKPRIDALVAAEVITGDLLADIAFSAQGLKTGDDDRWRRAVWEVQLLGNRWRLLQSTR